MALIFWWGRPDDEGETTVLVSSEAAGHKIRQSPAIEATVAVSAFAAGFRREPIFTRLNATIRVAPEHAAKSVTEVTVSLEVLLGPSEPGDPNVWLTDVQLQEGRRASAWFPEIQELFARHKQRKVVQAGTYAWSGVAEPGRLHNVVGRAGLVVVAPNFGDVPGPVEATVAARGVSPGLWTRPGRVPQAGPAHVRSIHRFEILTLGPPDEQGERHLTLARYPVSERRWEAALVYRNASQTQKATPDRDKWRIVNNDAATPPVSSLVIDDIPPFVDNMWQAHLDYIHTPPWAPHQMVKADTEAREVRAVPSVVGRSAIEPQTFGTTITIPRPPGEGGFLVALISGRQGLAGAPTAITHPGGWTERHVVHSETGEGQATGIVAVKPASDDDPAEWTWTFETNGLRAVGGIIRVHGEDPADPVAASSASAGVVGDIVTSGIDIPADALLLFLGASSPAGDVATPTGMLPVWDLHNRKSTTNRHFQRLAKTEQTPTEVAAIRTATHNGLGWVAFLVAIRPRPPVHPDLAALDRETVRRGGLPLIGGGPYVELEATYAAGTPLLEGQPITQGADGRMALASEARWTAQLRYLEYDADNPVFEPPRERIRTLHAADAATNDGPDDWQDPANAAGPADGAFATRQGALLGVDANLRLTYPPAGAETDSWVRRVFLRFHTRQTGTSQGDGGLHHEYRLSSLDPWTSLEVFDSDVDLLAEPRIYDITDAVGQDWQLIDNLEVRVRAVLPIIGGGIECACDAVTRDVRALGPHP